MVSERVRFTNLSADDKPALSSPTCPKTGPVAAWRALQPEVQHAE